MLANLVKESMEYPAIIKKIVGERAELEKQLSAPQDEEVRRKLQANLANTDRELEWLRSRQTAAVTTLNLLAALIGAGKAEDARVVLAALEGKPEPVQQNDGNKADKEKTKDQEELKSGTFTIKETKPGKKEGTVWATAIVDGAEYKICAKNGDGKALTEAVGKQAKVRYRTLGKDKLFAVKVEIAG